MKRRFAIGGAIVGLLYSGAPIVYAFVEVPSIPGPLELLFLGGFVGAFVSFGALTGLLLGWLIGLCIPKKLTRPPDTK
jgi:hypothetical protein